MHMTRVTAVSAAHVSSGVVQLSLQQEILCVVLQKGFLLLKEGGMQTVKTQKAVGSALDWVASVHIFYIIRRESDQKLERLRSVADGDSLQPIKRHTIG